MQFKLFPILFIFLTGCGASTYYQVYSTEFEHGNIESNILVFEDSNCKVFYNLWSDGGNAGFRIYNKTESDITIDMNRTFFIMNGIAYQYYQDRTYTYRTSIGLSSGVISSNKSESQTKNNITSIGHSSEVGISKKELTHRIIPSKASVIVNEFSINNQRIKFCDLPSAPSRKNIKSIKYSRENSPFVFSNHITYYSNSDTNYFDNNFFVSQIANFPESSLLSQIDTNNCGERLTYPVKVINSLGPNRFYIEYQVQK